MKTTNKFLAMAMLLSGVVFTSCQDESEFNTVPIPVGDEVMFGASAYFENGDFDGKTRTIYGNIHEGENGKKYIALNWVKGDKIEIVCPQDASGTKQAVYIIADGVEGGIDEGYVGEETDGNSYSNMLKKEDESGLRWGEGYTGTLNGSQTEGLHDFYALYPSRSSFKEDGHEGNIQIETEGTGQDAVVKVTGTMPVAQNPSQSLEKIAANGDTLAHYIVQPDMRYAYMVAKTTVSRYRPADEEEAPIKLEFTPLVTALQFDITGGLVAMDQYPTVKEVTIMQVSLASKSGKSICGNFTYNYSTGECVTSNTGTEGFNRITMDLTDNGVGGATLAKDEFCDVTFFLLPTAEMTSGDLQLTIMYEINGNVQYKVATIGRDLDAKKKYYFKDLVMPPIQTNISGSSWFGALDDPIYMQQVSLPIAGSAFSDLSTDVGSEVSGEPNISYTRQQVKDYQTLWDMGVRGFEFITQSTGNSSAENIGDLHFVCGETVLQNSDTFEEAFDYLAKFIADNETYPDYKDECLILICRYHAVDDGYSPERYVNNVLDFLEEKVGKNNYGLTADHFVDFGQEGLTVGDVKGKICIIIRPGDDDYMTWLTGNKTSAIELTGELASKVLLVQNWGSAFDRWDLRYGSNFAAEATWNDAISGGKDNFEDYLFAFSNSQTTAPSESSFKADRPVPAETFSLARTATGTSLTPMIQEWQRVIPKELDDQNICVYNTTGEYNDRNKSEDGYYLWVRWPESYTERTKAIDYTFQQSVAERGKTSANMFINTLSGYYSTKRHVDSLEPFMYSFTQTLNATSSLAYTPDTQTLSPTMDGETKYYVKFINLTNTYLGNSDADGDAATLSTSTESESLHWTFEGTVDDFVMQNHTGELYLAYNTNGYYYTTSSESNAVHLKLIDGTTDGTKAIQRVGQDVDCMNPQPYSSYSQKVREWENDGGCRIVFYTVKEDYVSVGGNTVTCTPEGQGKGGNFAELAVDMNTYVYNKLVNKEYGVGPYGLVVMDYIGASAEEFATHGGREYSTAEEREAAATASTALIRLIYMNNFAFELQRKETTGGEGGDNNGDENESTTQGASVSFSNNPADASGEIY